jgi:hypothetical protein
MNSHNLIVFCLLCGLSASAFAQDVLRNDRYEIALAADYTLGISVANMPTQRLMPEFTVLWSETDPLCTRDASHPNHPVAPRVAVRWRNPDEPLDALNAWPASPEWRTATGLTGSVRAEGNGRVWEFRDAQGKVTVRITGDRALFTTRPFTVGHRAVMGPVRSILEAGRVRWEYAPQPEFTLAAELALPDPEGDPALAFTLTPRRDAFFSVGFTGAPDTPLADTLPVPQECTARGHKLFNFVMSEADLHLARVHVATASGNLALVADPSECRFRLPTSADARFGLVLAHENGRLKPVLLAPLLGGPESRMRPGQPWRSTFRVVVRPGDWKDTYRHVARRLHGFRDQRDNSGPGSLNATLERVMDFLADRRGRNHAMWDAQQKYYDYFTDKTGVFKPFSPL